MTIRKKRNKKIKEILSPNQLQYWLEGILEFQMDDWVPTLDQWSLIKEKINSLDTTLVPPISNEHIGVTYPSVGRHINTPLNTSNYMTDNSNISENSISPMFDDQLASTPLDTTTLENMEPIGEPLIGSQLKSGIIDVKITDSSGAKSSFA